MRSFCTKSLFFAATAWCAASFAEAQETPSYNSPSLLPIPTVAQQYGQSQPVAYNRAVSPWSNYTADMSVKVQPAEPALVDPAPAPPGNSPYFPPSTVDHFETHPHAAAGADHGSYGSTGYGGRTLCSNWFGTVGGVIMTRDNADDLWLSFDTANISGRVLGSRDAEMDWGGGVEARIGRYFDCGNTGLEALYWGVYPSDEEANAYGADMVGALNTTLNFDSLEYDDGLGASAVVDWYDGALRHRVRRDYEFHNIELNLFGNPDCLTVGNCCGPHVRFGWLAGVRYFNFEENFEFASDETNTIFGDDPDSELLYRIGVENDLVGFQIGGRADYFFHPCLKLYSATKLGLYGNHISHDSFVGGGTGAAVINNPLSAYDGQLFDISSDKTDVAFLGELDLGLDYQVTQCWSIASGYRAVAVTGVALPTNQVPQFFDDLSGVENINSNGSLILHGAYVRAEFNY